MSDIERDAVRYRWLKKTNGEPFRDDLEGPIGSIGSVMVNVAQYDESGFGASSVSLEPDEMDAAIDAAMARWLDEAA